MTVAGNLSTVVEIVEHAELQCQFVLVRSDVGAVHGERGGAVAGFHVSQNLVVGAIFFDDVNNVLDGILAAGELNRPRFAVQQVIVLNQASEFFKLIKSGGNAEPRNRSAQQRGNVRMLAVPDLPRSLAWARARARAL